MGIAGNRIPEPDLGATPCLRIDEEVGRIRQETSVLCVPWVLRRVGVRRRAVGAVVEEAELDIDAGPFPRVDYIVPSFQGRLSELSTGNSLTLLRPEWVLTIPVARPNTHPVATASTHLL